MKEFVSDRRVTVAASISMLLLGWSIFVNPGGSWPGMLSVAALATLLVISTTVLLMGRTREPAASLAQVIQEVEKEPAHRPSADWKGKAIL
jgi:hypothetical protein